jgi:PHD/YefM family antitoxin component YafN of YafNO toxin-antitoxin module
MYTNMHKCLYRNVRPDDDRNADDCGGAKAVNEAARGVRQAAAVRAVKITRRKEPVMALMPWELFESLIETIDVMADERLMRELRGSLADIKAGRVLTLDQVAERFELDR